MVLRNQYCQPTHDGLRLGEKVAMSSIEIFRVLPSKFQMLYLIMPHRDVGSPSDGYSG